MSISDWMKRHRWLVSYGPKADAADHGTLQEEYGSGAGVSQLGESFEGDGEVMHPVGVAPTEDGSADS